LSKEKGRGLMVFRTEEKYKYNKLEAIRLMNVIRGRQEERKNEKDNSLCKGFDRDAGGERFT
jgi:hypothetical protein